jgi:hypothetical protein
MPYCLHYVVWISYVLLIYDRNVRFHVIPGHWRQKLWRNCCCLQRPKVTFWRHKLLPIIACTSHKRAITNLKSRGNNRSIIRLKQKSAGKPKTVWIHRITYWHTKIEIVWLFDCVISKIVKVNRPLTTVLVNKIVFIPTSIIDFLYVISGLVNIWFMTEIYLRIDNIYQALLSSTQNVTNTLFETW